MRRIFFAGMLFWLCGFAVAAGAGSWSEGEHYFRVHPEQPTSTPGKVEVLEVFSYACPACNQFEPTLNRLRASLPQQAKVAFLCASFNPGEDWPVFQRAYLAAKLLGVAETSHDAMYDAVWGAGSLALVEKSTHRWLPRDQQPTISDIARFYTAYGIKEEAFLKMANSFPVDVQMRRSDAKIRDLEVDSTPTIIVNGKYRLTPNTAGGLEQTIQLVLYLVSLEMGARSN